MSAGLLIRNALVDGRLCDLRIESGIVAEIGMGLRAAAWDIDARGGEVLPGLIDHHIHLFALAAQANSLVVDSGTNFAAALRDRDRAMAAGRALRVTGYHDDFHGPLNATRLDALVPDRPVRVQYRTGSLWVLNSRALAAVLEGAGIADCVERDEAGVPTGRIWRGDAWLRSRLAADPPPLAPVGSALARQGVTHLTDASANTTAETAALFAAAVKENTLPQHLMLMSAHALQRPPNAPWLLGPVKILLDEHDLPPLGDMVRIITDARQQNRRVAVHCVTAGELVLALAAFAQAGSQDGDRIEHGGIIMEELIADIGRLGLAVVTQPGFIAERGDTYLKDVAPHDHTNLYRCASLIAAGLKTAGSTDAPYTQPDLWAAIAAAVRRTTRSGQLLGSQERVSARRALGLFQGSFADPGGPPRRVAVGAPADLAVLRDSFDAIAAEGFAEPVAATLISGEPVWFAGCQKSD